jgi:hypothetical protein
VQWVPRSHSLPHRPPHCTGSLYDSNGLVDEEAREATTPPEATPPAIAAAPPPPLALPERAVDVAEGAIPPPPLPETRTACPAGGPAATAPGGPNDSIGAHLMEEAAALEAAAMGGATTPSPPAALPERAAALAPPAAVPGFAAPGIAAPDAPAVAAPAAAMPLPAPVPWMGTYPKMALLAEIVLCRRPCARHMAGVVWEFLARAPKRARMSPTFEAQSFLAFTNALSFALRAGITSSEMRM